MASTEQPEHAESSIVFPLLTTKSAAQYLSVSADTIRGLMMDGSVPHIRVANNIRFNRRALDEYLESKLTTTWEPDTRGRKRKKSEEV